MRRANAQYFEPAKGLYIGGAITQSKFDEENFDIDDFDDEDNSWKAIVGYRFNAEAKAFSVYGVGFVPLEAVDLFGKIGMARISNLTSESGGQ